MLFHSETKEIINSILKDKKILLNKNSYNSIIRIMDNNNDSVLSHSITKKIGFVTRHLLTAETTHSIVFEKEWYERL
jgi:hypothetical protein